MTCQVHEQSASRRRIKLRGFALPTLLVMLAMASIATLLALRNLWVNDQLLNAETDRLRTQHKAEAALPVALADILGAMASTSSNGTPNLRHTAGNATQSHAFFPVSAAEYKLLRQRLNTGTCVAGICAPSSLDPSATKASFWKARTNEAFAISASDTPYGDKTAWYWVEVLPQHPDNSANAPSFAPFIYRITTLANGVMPGSTTVLQAIWVRNTPTSSTGQWRSWHVLHD
jgi:Tfp pilus assembly protein PilX